MQPVDVSALVARIRTRMELIPFDSDDGASVRGAISATRKAIEHELWPYREDMAAVDACRALWVQAIDLLFASRDRARISLADCFHMAQWIPAPWLSVRPEHEPAQMWNHLKIRKRARRKKAA